MRAKIHILPLIKNLHAWPFKRGVHAVAIMGSIPQEKELGKLPELYLLTILVVCYTYFTLVGKL